MGVMKFHENYCVVVEPNPGWPTEATHEQKMADLENLRCTIRRHVDCRSAAKSVDLRLVCEFCGCRWTEGVNDTHNGGCCDADAANMPDALDATTEPARIFSEGSMSKKHDVYMSDDYAGLKIGRYHFYYGYEKLVCTNHNDEDCQNCEWAFVATLDDRELMRIGYSQLSGDGFSVEKNLIVGLGCFIESHLPAPAPSSPGQSPAAS